MLEAAAGELLSCASGGLPRSLNLLARAAWISAATQGAQKITAAHVQSTPWKACPACPALHSASASPNAEPSHVRPRGLSDRSCQAHELYCQLTGQKLRLDFCGNGSGMNSCIKASPCSRMRRVIVYLQREIREGRRNVGALKLSNLLQPDRFEEDLNIRCVRLEPPVRPAPSKSIVPLPPHERERRRRQALDHLQKLKQTLR